MRIAQIAPPWVAVPPVGYGGIERIISQLTEELVRRGHEVTLFATGDSTTGATLSYVFEKAVGNNFFLKANPFTTSFQVYPAFKNAASFDIIHSHEIQSLFFANLTKTPFVHTLHGTMYADELDELKRKCYQTFSGVSYVSISDSQRQGLPELNYTATVYNGIDMGEFAFSDTRGTYAVWLGRITPKKGVAEAIEVAKRVGIPLTIAAAIDPVDQPFFDTIVAPLVDGTRVRFVGELHGKEKSELLRSAAVLLMPIRWHEPFGLVMPEAMACGTPVIATRFGSTAEIIKDGVTGYVVEGTLWDVKEPISNWKKDEEGIANMTEALKKLLSLDDAAYRGMRVSSRKHAQDHFTIEKMVDGYEAVYRDLISKKTT